MVTEVVQNSKARKEPIFLLFLDAKSAFDTVVIQYLIRNMYFAGVDGNALLYFDHRLNNRKTYCDWDNCLMGPIHDQHGLEQGGINSSDMYELHNNKLLASV